MRPHPRKRSLFEVITTGSRLLVRTRRDHGSTWHFTFTERDFTSLSVSANQRFIILCCGPDKVCVLNGEDIDAISEAGGNYGVKVTHRRDEQFRVHLPDGSVRLVPASRFPDIIE